ncbi:MAG: VOC family protein [Pyrinomonadaceae bacterium]
MAKILGVGGVFLKSEDPEKLYGWYEKHLGLSIGDWPGATFPPKDLPSNSYSVLSFISSRTDHFSPSNKTFMLKFIVDDLRQAIKQVKEGGGRIMGEIETYDNGIFGWFIDPDGNKIELWEVKR